MPPVQQTTDAKQPGQNILRLTVTTDAIFMARQMQENFRVKGKKLYFGFVDLEKAFDRVPRSDKRSDKLGNA